MTHPLAAALRARAQALAEQAKHARAKAARAKAARLRAVVLALRIKSRAKELDK